MSNEERIEQLLAAISRALAGDYAILREPARADDAEGSPNWLHALEFAVTMLIAELAETKLRNQEQILEIEAKNREITERQALALRALGTPLISVWDGILTLPLIGAIDAERGQALVEALLERVVAERARYVIIDVTGASNLEVTTAQYLLRAARAVRLLGSVCILSGISPETASAFVQLGMLFSEVRTTRRLSEALKAAFSEMKLTVSTGDRKEQSHG